MPSADAHVTPVRPPAPPAPARRRPAQRRRRRAPRQRPEQDENSEAPATPARKPAIVCSSADALDEQLFASVSPTHYSRSGARKTRAEQPQQPPAQPEAPQDPSPPPLVINKLPPPAPVRRPPAAAVPQPDVAAAPVAEPAVAPAAELPPAPAPTSDPAAELPPAPAPATSEALPSSPLKGLYTQEEDDLMRALEASADAAGGAAVVVDVAAQLRERVAALEVQTVEQARQLERARADLRRAEALAAEQAQQRRMSARRWRLWSTVAAAVGLGAMVVSRRG